MKKNGIYFYENNISLNEDCIIDLKNKSVDISFYSNFKSKNVIFHAEKKDFSKEMYSDCIKKIKNLSIIFYKEYSSTPLFNENFNFWTNLRFNSYIDLLILYKIEYWVTDINKNHKIDELIFVDVDVKIKNILFFLYPNSKFIYTKKQNKKAKSKFLKNTIQIFYYGGISLFSIFKKKKKTLFISLRNDIVTILTKNKLQKKDKFTFHISNLIHPNEKDLILNTNIFSIKGLNIYQNDSTFKQFDYKVETLLFYSMFKLKFYKEIYKTYKYIKKIEKSEKSFLSVLIKNKKGSLFTELLTFWTYYFFLRKRKYKNIVISDEMSPATNSIVRAAKQLSINVIGIQHGLLNNNNFAYNYSDEELKIDNPFPHKLIVWGKEEFDFLVKNKSILKDTVQPLGNVILDGLKYLPKKEESAIFTVLFATQPQPIMSQRMKSVTDFVEAILKFDVNEIKIIIRLHPRELNDYDLYKDSFSKLKNYEVELDTGKELFSQINKADVLVTSYSTVSKDAMILRKPIVLQDYSESDITGLIRKEVAINTLNSNELFTVLTQIKDKELKINSDKYEKALSEIYASTNFEVAGEIVKLFK